MVRFSRISSCLVAAAIGVFVIRATSAATPVTIFQDNFQSDTAGQTGSTLDLDPVIGTGDVGGNWTVRESTTLHTQVINDTTPGNATPGTENYLQMIRGGSSSSTSRPYITGWTTANTANAVLQLDFTMWQQTDGDLTVIFLNQAPPASTGNPNFANASVFVDLGAITSGAVVDVPDLDWHTVRIVANLSDSTQMGVDAQNYTVSVDDTLVSTVAFNATNHQVQSIGFYSGANNKTEYIDNIVLQNLTPPGLQGDYNNNGFVDAADYVVWRSGVQPLTNEVTGVTPGSTTDEDYVAWRALFGNPSPASGGSLAGAQVPEPATTNLALVLLAAGCARFRLRTRRSDY